MKKLLTELPVKLYHNEIVNDKKEIITYLSLEIEFDQLDTNIMLAPKDKAEKKLLNSYLKVNKIYDKEDN